MVKGFINLPLLVVLLFLTLSAGLYIGKNGLPSVTNLPATTENDIEQKNETTNWETYINTGQKYSIKYPADFKIEELEKRTVLYKGEKFNPPPNSPLDPFGPTISLAIYDRTSSKMKWKSGREACEAELCQNAKDISVGKTYTIEDVTINNGTGVKVTTTNAPSIVDYYLGSTNGSSIVLISFNEQAEKERKLLDQIISSFKFTDQTNNQTNSSVKKLNYSLPSG